MMFRAPTAETALVKMHLGSARKARCGARSGNNWNRIYLKRDSTGLGTGYLRRHPPQHRSGEATLAASIEDRHSVLVTLLGDVAKNYIDLRGLQRRLAVAQANLQAQQDTLDLTKIRFDAGLASDFDVAQAEGQVKTTAAQIPTLQTALKQTAYRIDILLGTQPGASWSELAKDAPIPALPPEAHVGLPADLLRRRPDIRQRGTPIGRRHGASRCCHRGSLSEIFPAGNVWLTKHQRE